MLVIPANTSGLKLSSWVFDAHMEKDCARVRVKGAGIGTCSSWVSMENKLSNILRPVAEALPNLLVKKKPALWLW